MLVEQAPTVGARIVVVDNDPDGSAEPHVRTWSDHGVGYVHEKRPGLAAARNCALNRAREADVLVFIDDDETPSPHWLSELVRAWQIWRCTAVTGPVRPVFDGQVDPWVLATGTFGRRRLATGEHVFGAATNNLLLDVAQVTALGLAFDERFGLTGGEDTMFVHDLLRRGGTIRWCDEAEVQELIPPSRSSRRWVLGRTFRAGTTWSQVALALAKGRVCRVRERLELTLRAIWRIITGVAHFTRGVLGRNVTDRARGACAVTAGAGMLAGAYGYRYYEYRR